MDSPTCLEEGCITAAIERQTSLEAVTTWRREKKDSLDVLLKLGAGCGGRHLCWDFSSDDERAKDLAYE